MWTLFEKPIEERTKLIVSLWTSKPSIDAIVDALNVSIEKAEMLLRGSNIKTDSGIYTLTQN